MLAQVWVYAQVSACACVGVCTDVCEMDLECVYTGLKCFCIGLECVHRSMFVCELCVHKSVCAQV